MFPVFPQSVFLFISHSGLQFLFPVFLLLPTFRAEARRFTEVGRKKQVGERERETESEREALPPTTTPLLVPLPSQDGPVCLRIATKNSSVLIECIKKSEISNIYSKNTINHFYPNVRMHRTKRHAVEAVERGSNISLHSFTSRPLARFKPSGFLVEIRIMYEFWCIVL